MSRAALQQVLVDARAMVARPGNDFTSSFWDDAPAALAELDRHLQTLAFGPLHPADLASIFAPTGGLQEVALSSGWADAYAGLADRFDAAAAAADVTRGRFACSLCPLPAATIDLDADGLRRDTFTGVMFRPGAPSDAVRAAVEQADARALHALDPELAPQHCPECDADYCGAHWAIWDVFDDDDPAWHDSIRGRCPAGHEGMLED